MRSKKLNINAIYLVICGIAAITFCLLLVLPGTGWLVRYQVKILTHRPIDLILLLKDMGVKELPGVDGDIPPQMDVLANRALDNSYQEQLSAALSAPYGKQVNMLVALAQKCNGAERAEALAHALRLDTMGTIRIQRDDEVSAYWGETASTYAPARETPRSEFELFDRTAAEGERLDPDNAYFPMMRAVGLFATHRDAEGLEAIRRAGSKTKYEDYAMNDAVVRLAHLERRAGRQTSIASLMVIASALFPHYAQLRASARFVAYSASKAEQAGRNEEGFVLRRAMMRCGSMMRVQSRSQIGSLVGDAIVPICMQTNESHYGGIGKTAWNALTPEQRRSRRIELYTAYLKRTGHPEEAPWVVQEQAMGDLARHIGQQAIDSGPMGSQTLGTIFRMFGGTMLVLANAAELLLLCGAMWICKGNRSAERIALVTLLLLFVICAFRMEWAPAMVGLREVVSNLSDPNASTLNGTSASQFVFSVFSGSPVVVRFVAIFGCLIGPVFAVAVLTIMRLARGKQEESVIASGLRRGGAVIAMLLVATYALALAGLVKEETAQRRAQLRMMQGESAYYSELVGKPWPPAAPEPVGEH